jgi:hypothetical protein
MNSEKEGRTLILYKGEIGKKGIITLLLFLGMVIPQLLCYFWGNSIMKSSCNDLTLRQSLRGILCSGIFSAVILIVYGLCNTSCRYEEENKEGKLILQTRTRELPVPLFLLLILMGVLIANLYFCFSILEELNSNNCKIDSGNYKTIGLPLIIFFNFLILFIIIVVIVYEMYNRNKKSKEERERIKIIKSQIFEDENKLSEKQQIEERNLSEREQKLIDLENQRRKEKEIEEQGNRELEKKRQENRKKEEDLRRRRESVLLAERKNIIKEEDHVKEEDNSSLQITKPRTIRLRGNSKNPRNRKIINTKQEIENQSDSIAYNQSNSNPFNMSPKNELSSISSSDTSSLINNPPPLDPRSDVNFDSNFPLDRDD